MISSTIWKQLKLTLENDPVLSRYIRQVFEGVTYNVEPDVLPCLMIEPTQNGELQNEMNTIQDVYLDVDIYAFSSNNMHDSSKTIVGGQDYKGILDIENDIRACLASSYTLGNRVIDIKQQTAQFDRGEFGKTPVRGLVIPIRILYRQINNL